MLITSDPGITTAATLSGLQSRLKTTTAYIAVPAAEL